MTPQERQARINSARRKLDVLEAHPEIPLVPFVDVPPDQTWFMCFSKLDDMKNIAQVLVALDPAASQNNSGHHINLHAVVDGVPICAFADRNILVHAAPLPPVPELLPAASPELVPA